MRSAGAKVTRGRRGGRRASKKGARRRKEGRWDSHIGDVDPYAPPLEARGIHHGAVGGRGRLYGRGFHAEGEREKVGKRERERGKAGEKEAVIKAKTGAKSDRNVGADRSATAGKSER